jgi:hypothetical protein
MQNEGIADSLETIFSLDRINDSEQIEQVLCLVRQGKDRP